LFFGELFGHALPQVNQGKLESGSALDILVNDLAHERADCLVEDLVGESTIVGRLLGSVEGLDVAVVQGLVRVLVPHLGNEASESLNTGVPVLGAGLTFLLLFQDEANIVEDFEQSLQSLLSVEEAEVLVTFLENLAEDEGVSQIGDDLGLVSHVALEGVNAGLVLGQVILRIAGPEAVTLVLKLVLLTGNTAQADEGEGCLEEGLGKQLPFLIEHTDLVGFEGKGE